MEESLKQQEKDLQEQTKIYIAEMEKKNEEEKELAKVFDDYKGRFVDFDKSIKMSRSNMKTYEKEIAAMNKRIKMLETEKQDALQQANGVVTPLLGGKKKNKKNN